MPGPWEEYQTQSQAKPWEQYKGTTPQTPVAPTDGGFSTGDPALDAMGSDIMETARGGALKAGRGVAKILQQEPSDIPGLEQYPALVRGVVSAGEGLADVAAGGLQYFGSPTAPLFAPYQKPIHQVGEVTREATGSPLLGSIAEGSAGLAAGMVAFGGFPRGAASGPGAAIARGVDPAVLARNMSAQYAREARTATRPRETLQQAQTLPKPVKLTTGQLTGDPSQMLFEDMARQGSKGQIARQVMERADTETRDALFGNIDAIQGQIAGTAPVIERGHGMAAAQQAIVKQATQAQEGVTRAYDAARQGGDAGIGQSAWLRGTQDIRENVASNFRPGNIPKTWATLEDLFGEATQGGEVTPLVSKIFQTRQQLAALQREGGVEGAAASQAKAALDKWTGTLAQEPGALTGDPGAIGRWRTAIGLRAQYGQRFGSGIVADMVERDPQAGNRLVIDPSEAAHRLLGDTPQSMANRADLSRNLAQLRDVLGKESGEWAQVRQELFMRLVEPARGGPLHGGTGNQFSAVQFVKSFDNFVRANPQLARVVLNPDEMAVMRQLRDVASRTIVKPGGRQLGSAAAWSNMISSAFPTIARFFNIVGHIPGVDQVAHIPASMKAMRAASGTLPRRYQGRPTPPPTPRPPSSPMSGTMYSNPLDPAAFRQLFGRRSPPPRPPIPPGQTAADVIRQQGRAQEPLTLGPENEAQIAYHGTPHDFDRFDMSKIGTGEGAQAYGHGLYFAESEGVARSYRDNLTSQASRDVILREAGGQRVLPANEQVGVRARGRSPEDIGAQQMRLQGSAEAAIEHLESVAETYAETARRQMRNASTAKRKTARDIHLADAEGFAKDYKALSDAAAWLKANAAKLSLGEQKQGRVYQVAIKAKPEEFLDWDKPFGEQPKPVQDILRRALPPSLIFGKWGKGQSGWTTAYERSSVPVDQATGRQLHEALGKLLSEDVAGRGPKITEALRKAGIKGIRYLDRDSRVGQGGTSNFVVFDDKIISVLKKYGIPMTVTAAGAAIVAAGAMPPEIKAQIERTGT